VALSTKVTSFNTGTGAAATTVDVTLGFQPAAVILWWSGRTEATDTVARADSHIGVGFATDDTHRNCSCWVRDDGAAAEAGANILRNDAVVARMLVDGTADGALDVDATANWPADGIRFVVDTQFGASVRVHLFAVGGTDITNVDCGTFAAPTVVGNNTTVTPGFEAQVIFFHGSRETASTARASLYFGAATSTSAQAVCGVMFDPGATSGDGGMYVRDGDEMGVVIDTANPAAVLERMNLEVLGATTFEVNKLEGTSAVLNGYLAIRGASWAMGNLLTQTDTTTTSTVSGLPFQPAGIVFASGCRAEDASDTGTTPTRWSVGAATTTSERAAMGETGAQGSANTRVGTAVEHDAVYVNLADVANDGDPQTIQGVMDLNSITSDGFTTIMDDADPSQAFVWWVAVGNPAGGRTTRNTRAAGLGMELGMNLWGQI
jgi:hypothetical protein